MNRRETASSPESHKQRVAKLGLNVGSCRHVLTGSSCPPPVPTSLSSSGFSLDTDLVVHPLVSYLRRARGGFVTLRLRDSGENGHGFEMPERPPRAAFCFPDAERSRGGAPGAVPRAGPAALLCSSRKKGEESARLSGDPSLRTLSFQQCGIFSFAAVALTATSLFRCAASQQSASC